MELTFFVDHQCNIRCKYCYTGEKYNARLSLDSVDKALELALQQPLPSIDVHFFGGEPLMFRSLLEQIVERTESRVGKLPAPRPVLRFVLNTNAILVDDWVLKLLAAPRRGYAIVSLDGPESTHDRFRVDVLGRGTHARVKVGIAKLVEAKIPLQLVGVYGATTARSLGTTVEELLAYDTQRVSLAPNLRDDWTEESIAELRSGLRDAGEVWMRHFRAGTTKILEPLHGKILTHLKGGIPCPSRCQLGNGEFAVAPSGNLYPCAQMVEEDRNHTHVIGHVDSGFDRAKILAMQSQKDQVEDTCAPCELRTRCQSHCGCRHIALTGSLGQIDARLCEIEESIIEAADYVAETLWAEKNPTFLELYYSRQWKASQGGVLTALRRSRDGDAVQECTAPSK